MDGASKLSVSSSSRVPACDPCRERKTKCNRAVPCSSCLTAKIDCHISNTRPEKRQRVLIWSKYDEALESVDSRLQQVLDAVTSLQGAVQPRSDPLQRVPDFRGGFLSRQETMLDAYRGESSLEAQFRGWEEAWQRHSVPLPSVTAAFGSASTSSFSEILTWTPGTSSSLSPTAAPSIAIADRAHLNGRTLPPSDAVLRLLRLTQAEKQRFFLDVDLFDEQHFADLCKQVFFAISPYSSHVWAIVNVGLYYLFHALNADRSDEIGLRAADIDNVIDLLARNAQAAVDDFRVCHDASLEACQALALLGTFCMKSGQVDRAGSLFSTAARTCLDLGLHALPPGVADMTQSRGRKVLWYVFLTEKGLELTIGRPQSLHFYDIATDTSSHPNDVLGIPAKIAAAFFELALIEDEMIPQLFSASARHFDSATRWEKGQGFHERLKKIRLELILRDTSADSPFNEASILVNVLVASVKTLVCWTSAERDPGSRSCHACHGCVDDARWALQAVGETAESKSKGWAMLLNIILCLAPFTPYLVLASHAATPKDAQDLLLLQRVKEVLSRAATDSPIAKKTLETCSRLDSCAENNSPTAPSKHGPTFLDNARQLGQPFSDPELSALSPETPRVVDEAAWVAI